MTRCPGVNSWKQMTHDSDHVGGESQSESPIVGLKVDPSVVNTLSTFRTKMQIFISVGAPWIPHTSKDSLGHGTDVTCARALGNRQRSVAEGSFGVNRILSSRDLLAVVTATGAAGCRWCCGSPSWTSSERFNTSALKSRGRVSSAQSPLPFNCADSFNSPLRLTCGGLLKERLQYLVPCWLGQSDLCSDTFFFAKPECYLNAK
jgi:hypothetical protein